jgi:hypothetical protein
MKKRLAAFLMACAVMLATIFAAPAFAQDRWTGPDKRLHLGVSAAIGIATRSQWPDEPGKAWLVAMVPGLAKELLDIGSTGFSVKDMVANGIGAYLGTRIAGLFIDPVRQQIGVRIPL